MRGATLATRNFFFSLWYPAGVVTEVGLSLVDVKISWVKRRHVRLDQQMCYFCVIYPFKTSENTPRSADTFSDNTPASRLLMDSHSEVAQPLCVYALNALFCISIAHTTTPHPPISPPAKITNNTAIENRKSPLCPRLFCLFFLLLLFFNIANGETSKRPYCFRSGPIAAWNSV